MTNNYFQCDFLQVQRADAINGMKLIVIRFLIGVISVSTFAVIGDLFKPKSFAGLFGAAPSVALATLALAVMVDGRQNAIMQSTSMTVSAIALFCYASCVSRIMMRRPWPAIWVSVCVLPVWAAVSFGLWFVLLR